MAKSNRSLLVGRGGGASADRRPERTSASAADDGKSETPTSVISGGKTVTTITMRTARTAARFRSPNNIIIMLTETMRVRWTVGRWTVGSHADLQRTDEGKKYGAKLVVYKGMDRLADAK